MKKKEGLFYYVRSARNNAPVVTVCLVSDGTNTARGISICSMRDVVCKKEGRKVALAYAKKALGTKRNTGSINRDEAVMSLIYHKCNEAVLALSPVGYHKSEFNPTLTDYEKGLIEKGKK